MAIIACPECKAEVSDQAYKCTQCGFQLRKPKRGIFGKLILWSFWLFNLLMVLWLYGGMSSASQRMDGLAGAEKTGAVIGTGLGAAMIIVVWVAGAIILGIAALLTRPKTS